jgi:MGT family glycosyltransferase
MSGTAPLRVLLACQPVPGHLHPNLAVAAALRARGHDVAIYSGRLAQPAVERLGARFFPYGDAMDELLTRAMLPPTGSSPAARASTDWRGFFRVRTLNTALRGWLLDSIPDQVKDLDAIVASFRPDVLVSDVTLLAPILLRDRFTVPVAVFSVLAACSVPGPEAPPWGRGLPPPRTPWTRAQAAVERWAIDRLLSGLRHEASRLRTAYGLPPLRGRLADEYGRVPLFMVASVPEFDYERRDLPPSVEYVGACVWGGGAQAAVPLPWLDGLPRDRPLVHVTEGTIHTREPLVLRAAAQGLADRPMHVVMTTGRHRRPEELRLGRIAPNVRVEQFVPHHTLFARTDAVVTTGGAGTVTTALLAGVPLVVVPTGWDLPENAQRAVESGVGVRLDPGRCTPARLRAAVEEVLSKPAYRASARRVGAALAGAGGQERAASLIEAFASRPQRIEQSA